jgi:hypothetical protein
MVRRFLVFVCTVATIAGLSAVTVTGPPAGATTSECGLTPTPPTSYKHVIWLWMENKQYSDVFTGANAPYLQGLASRCGTATNYSSVGAPSLPNYLGATSGQLTNVAPFTSDCSPSKTCKLKTDNLFRQVLTAGGTWKSYEESMKSNCELAFQDGKYAVRHNPAAYYKGGSDRASCKVNDIKLGKPTHGNFFNDLTNNTLPTFSFVTPNLINDGHDGSSTAAEVQASDTFASTWVPRIVASAAYQAGATALFIVWDEETPMPNVIVAPSVLTGTVSATAFNHYSLLRTTEKMLGLPLLGQAATAADMRSAFNL